MSGRIRKAFIPLLVVVMVALAVPVSAGAVTAQSAWSDWMTMREAAENPQIFIVGTQKEWATPSISGNNIVYCERLIDADGTGPGSTPGDWNIKAYNLVSDTYVTVTVAAGDQIDPKISGSWIVYTDEAKGAADGDITSFNLSTRETREIAPNLDDVSSPDVSGSIAVWENLTDNSIEWFDMASDDGATMVNNGHSPSLSGKRLAFVRGGGTYLKDLTTNAETQIYPESNGNLPPRVDGPYVVFGDSANDVWAYDDSTGAPPTRIRTTTGNCYLPDVHGTIAVWQTYDGGPDYLYLEAYDFLTGEVVTLAEADDVGYSSPMIWGNRVVFTRDDDNFVVGRGDIMLGTISAPVINLSGATTIGYGAKPAFTGTITENGIALGSKQVFVDKSTNGGHTWSQVATLTTDGSGAFGYTGSTLYRKAWFRARFNGERDGSIIFNLYQSRFSMVSSSRGIAPKALVGKPAGYPASARKNKTYSTYGSLKPRQPVPDEDDWIMHIKAYHRENGKWVLRKTILADVYNYSSYSRYRGSLKLTRSGRWRIRGHFDGSATNASAVGPYKYVYVY